jgi:hypothetical protein
VLGDEEFLDDASADQVFLDDALEDRRIAPAVPRTFRIDDGDRSALANLETVRFRSQDAALLGQPEVLQTFLQEVPGGNAARLVAALRRGLISAEKNVPARLRETSSVPDHRSTRCVSYGEAGPAGPNAILCRPEIN